MAKTTYSLDHAHRKAPQWPCRIAVATMLRLQVHMGHEVEALQSWDSVDDEKVALGETCPCGSEKLLGHGVVWLQFEVVKCTHRHHGEHQGELVDKQERRVG